MSAYVLGYAFDDSDTQATEALETIVAHMNIDEDILSDYLFCCEEFGFEPSTVEELASYVLSPDLDYYFQTNFGYGYPDDNAAYNDIGQFLLGDTDLDRQLRARGSNLWTYFDFERYARDYCQNNAFVLGRHGFLEEPPKGNIIISKDEIIELANYLSGHTYKQSEISKIMSSINVDVLDITTCRAC